MKFTAVSTLLALIFPAAIAAVDGAQAYGFQTIHTFCESRHACKDGGESAGLLLDSTGNLFGTATVGGKENKGVVFELSPKAGSGTWTYRLLYSFCRKADCVDGAEPLGPVIMDTSGNLYGTTNSGGDHNMGVIFELSPTATGGGWKERVIHHFGSRRDDGALPYVGLAYFGAADGVPYDGTSPLYGTTLEGGAGGGFGNGTVFELSPRPGNRGWLVRTIYKFCKNNPCIDGSAPTRAGSLIVDASGTVYGTTAHGGTGTHDGGVAFQLSPANGKWNETVLYNFCNEPNCSDGFWPGANLTMDAAGNLLGTATNGGANGVGGVLFKISPNGRHSQYSVLYNFCSNTNCGDGESPAQKLLIDGAGSLIGTTDTGGAFTHGTAFRWNGTLQTLHDFCDVRQHCPEGELPSDLVMNGNAAFFGATRVGGPSGEGAAFELIPD
jgi:uncharacterized repeat protein (TIGR03803 family)